MATLTACILVMAAGLGPSGAHALEDDLPGEFELVGADPLLSRGMNSALAVRGDHVYVGSRSDGSRPHPGILVVDVSDPSAPQVVHEIGPPHAGNLGETARELRIWPDQELLVVLNFGCHPAGHVCHGEPMVDVEPTVRFFDIGGERAAAPELVGEYAVPDVPHEFFLWVDPEQEGRALLYITTPYIGTGADIDLERPHLLVVDISDARHGEVEELIRWSPERDPDREEAGMHSLSVSHDGRTAYLAELEGGIKLADTTDLAEGVSDPEIVQLTPPDQTVHNETPGVHSAVPLPGRPYVLLTDEVYGRGLGLGPFIGFNMLRGCPWGWSRIIDVRDPAAPSLSAEYKLSPWNDEDRCDEVRPDQDEGVSFSSHNPTVTENLALISWHTAGLVAADLEDPTAPTTAAVFEPDPLPAVLTEDPVLTGLDEIIVWSYPVVQDGLIYVTDVRNGLFILRYHGPHGDELTCRDFLEGNSNVGVAEATCPQPHGDAPPAEPPAGPPSDVPPDGPSGDPPSEGETGLPTSSSQEQLPATGVGMAPLLGVLLLTGLFALGWCVRPES